VEADTGDAVSEWEIWPLSSWTLFHRLFK